MFKVKKKIVLKKKLEPTEIRNYTLNSRYCHDPVAYFKNVKL